MLVENTEPKSRMIGPLHLIPGFNKIDDKEWDKLAQSSKWAKPIKGLIDFGLIKVDDVRKKITIDMVKKTYDVELLNTWLEKAKGPLKGAITKQIELMAVSPKEEEKDDNLGNL